MDLNIIEHDFPPEFDRGHCISMTIKSFKGRRNVQVHLFRAAWDPTEEANYEWDNMLGAPIDPSMQPDPEGSRKIYMESFGPGERDAIVGFLQRVYADKLAAIEAQPLSFPIPMGLTALSSVPEGKDIGIIRFEKIPSYDLGIPLHGLYDLSQHEPLA